MTPLKHRIKTKLIQTSSDLEKKNLRGEWLACLLWRYANRVRFALKKRNGIAMAVDHAEFMENRIGVAGWALSSQGSAGIQRIEVYLDDVLLGNAVYGDARGDVERIYPFLKQSRYGGFHFYADVRNGLTHENGYHAITVRVIGKDGRMHQKLKSLMDTYALWMKHHEPDRSELEQQRQTTFAYTPLISLITPTYNTPRRFLIEMLESVRNQTYPHWELCLADGASESAEVKEILTRYASEDPRMKVAWLTENKGIVGNSNAALALATGDFVGLLDHDDTLAPFALFEVVKYLNTHQETDYLYSDEDRLSDDGTIRYDPYFKPDWSPDTLRSTNYPTHFSVFRKNLLDRVGGFREGFEGSQDYDLILRITEQTQAISHISKVLYHWRMHNTSLARDACSKEYAYRSAQKALQEHLERIHVQGSVEETEQLGYYKVIYQLPATPTISIIIPNRDHADVLKRCVNSIIRKSHYEQFEILIIENGSREKQTFLLYDYLRRDPRVQVLEWHDHFNYAAINNFGARHAQGEVLLFLNNDTEVISVDWLERMLEHAVQTHVGAVGAKLYYPDQTIQHAGIIIGMTGVAGYSHKYLPGYTPGYRGRLRIVHNVSAVTGACLMMCRVIFDDVKGFDERFAYAFNDVDLCLRVRTLGYLNVWTPYAELYHHESVTRGLDTTPEQRAQFEREQTLFGQQWRQILAVGDPYYNRNLSLDREDFSIRPIY